jgi:hypothetical protein
MVGSFFYLNDSGDSGFTLEPYDFQVPCAVRGTAQILRLHSSLRPSTSAFASLSLRSGLRSGHAQNDEGDFDEGAF